MATVTQTAIPPWESLLTLGRTLLVRWESLKGLSPSGISQWEAVGLLSPSATILWETQFFIVDQSSIPLYEALQGRSRSQEVPWEIGSRAPVSPLRVEAGGSFSIGAVAGQVSDE